MINFNKTLTIYSQGVLELIYVVSCKNPTTKPYSISQIKILLKIVYGKIICMLLLFITIISFMEKMASLRKKKTYTTLQVPQKLGLSEEVNNVGKQKLCLQDETSARGNTSKLTLSRPTVPDLKH